MNYYFSIKRSQMLEPHDPIQFSFIRGTLCLNLFLSNSNLIKPNCVRERTYGLNFVENILLKCAYSLP